MNGFHLSSENLLLVMFKESELSRTQVLQKLLKETDPDKVKILHDNKGKPYFPNLPLHLSVSTVNDLTLIAVSQDPVGLDAEAERKVHYELILRRFFSKEEQEHLLPHLDLKSFLTVWTQKEAYVKYLGKGIDDSFRLFSVFSVPEKIYTFPLDHLTVSICTKKAKTIVVFPALQEEA